MPLAWDGLGLGLVGWRRLWWDLGLGLGLLLGWDRPWERLGLVRIRWEQMGWDRWGWVLVVQRLRQRTTSTTTSRRMMRSSRLLMRG